jgi:hypothetical protein
MSRQCYQLAVKQNYKVLTLGKLGSAELGSLSPETMSVEAPVLSLLGFGAAENFESVILIPFWASEASLVRMRSRELSLWWSGGIRKRKSEVKNRRGMNGHSHERAGIHAHECEERNYIDKCARVECILVHELRQQDGDTSITVGTYSDKVCNRNYAVEKLGQCVGDGALVNEQSKRPASNGIERERRNHVDCPVQGNRRLHDGIPHCEFTHCFTLVHCVYK